MKDFSRGLDSTCSACVPTLQVHSHCSICFSQPWNSFYNSLVAFCLGELMPATTGEPQFIIFNCTHTVVSSSVRLHVSSPLINWNIRSWRNLHSCPKKKWKPPKNCSGLPFIHTFPRSPSAGPNSSSFVHNSTICFFLNFTSISPVLSVMPYPHLCWQFWSQVLSLLFLPC